MAEIIDSSVETTDEGILYEDDVFANAPPRSSIFDYIWSSILVGIILGIFAVQNTGEYLHWMVLPLAFCGTIVGADAIRWLTGKYAVFDPKGLAGFYGLNFFLIAPLLIVFYHMEGIETYVVADWHPLLGLMAICNAVGLILYKIFQRIGFKRRSKVERTYWALSQGRASMYLPMFWGIAFLSFCVFITRAGGFDALVLQEGSNEGIAELKGFGLIMILRDALPMTTLILLTVFRKSIAPDEDSRVWLFVAIGILILFFVTSGLRGSRAATGMGIVCASGMIHFFWRRLTIPKILIAMIPLVLFFYVYGFYKSAGIAGITELIQGRTSLASLQERTTRTFTGMLIGDMSRAHVQGIEMDVLAYNKPWPYRYRYGTTYLYGLISFTPRQLWPSKPIDTNRLVAGTEALYGPGAYAPIQYVNFSGGSRSTQIYGLAGEAMLNFGLLGIPVAFAVWGYVVGRVRKRLYSFRAGDMRLYMAGFWLLFGFLFLTSDLEILLWFFMSLYIIPAMLIFLISDKIKLDCELGGENG